MTISDADGLTAGVAIKWKIEMADDRSSCPLWTPSSERVARAGITRFMAWVGERHGPIGDYEDLRRWSINDIDRFWRAIWDYFAVGAPVAAGSALTRRTMPDAEWFPGETVNFAEQVLARAPESEPAIIAFDEQLNRRDVSTAELREAVLDAAAAMLSIGVKPGDRVVAILPNIPEAIIAMLATASIGAIWSIVSPETGSAAVIARFGQLEPRLLIAAQGYDLRGNHVDRRKNLEAVVEGLPSVEHVITLPQGTPALHCRATVISWPDFLVRGEGAPRSDRPFAAVPFAHPLWVLYSSGTTGIPKAMVQSHGGILLEMLKGSALHLDLQPGERLFFYSITGWMIWNLMFGALLTGSSVILYDGHPSHPDLGKLWQVAELGGATVFGASPSYVKMLMEGDYRPGERHALPKLQSILLSGAPVSAEVMCWLTEAVKKDLWVQSACGGTDVCTSFVGGVPILPVYAGEIQARGLGIDAAALDPDGTELTDEVGELVIRQPMPSMPVFFWNDPLGSRYRDAYFDTYPGMWRQGDFVRFNARGGAFVLGRSDATLNRHGVRIGTAEIYSALDRLSAIADGLIITVDLPNGDMWMPLFVQLAKGAILDADSVLMIRNHLKTSLSPRHVPDDIIEVPFIPYNRTGKRLEIPVRRILSGLPQAEAVSGAAVADMDEFETFMEIARINTEKAIAAAVVAGANTP